MLLPTELQCTMATCLQLCQLPLLLSFTHLEKFHPPGKVYVHVHVCCHGCMLWYSSSTHTVYVYMLIFIVHSLLYNWPTLLSGWRYERLDFLEKTQAISNASEKERFGEGSVHGNMLHLVPARQHLQGRGSLLQWYVPVNSGCTATVRAWV